MATVTISKEAIEAAARAIASSKRRPEERSELIIDRVWSSYVGMARDALAAAVPFLSLTTDNRCNEDSGMVDMLDGTLPLQKRIQYLLDRDPWHDWATNTSIKTKECVLLIAQEVDDLNRRLSRVDLYMDSPK